MMLLKPLILLFITFTISTTVLSQDNVWPSNLHEAMDDINPMATNLFFNNSLEINNTGGHIQGIQLVNYKSNGFYFLSGSSSEYSYYAIVKTGEVNMVISVNKILDKPLKHAGGFQIWENLMAIGVEDNEAKNKSRVFIFKVDNPEKPPTKPLTIIERIGTFKRATAGCVAITIVNGKILVVVGDWDTKHLDFYRISEEKLYEEGAILELEYTINSDNFNKSNWIDENWSSYQNINFLQDSNQNLYLAGITSSEKDEEIIDIFLVESEDLSSFVFTKVYSRKFPMNPRTKFRWGAGIHVDMDGKIMLISSEENINNESLFTIYK